MSIALHGHGISSGIAIGNVHILQRHQLEISEYVLPSKLIDEEVERFRSALDEARQQLREIRAHIPRETAVDIASFIDTHILMLDDPGITEAPIGMIREHHCNAEWALKLQRDAIVAVFDAMDDSYLRTRKDDIDHVVDRLQRILLDKRAPAHEVPDSRLQGYILLADDLTPSDTVLIQHHGIVAFVTEYGGPTSHTAILARSLRIPAIVGLRNARRYIREGEVLIVDSNQGVAVIEPDERTLRQYRRHQKEDRRYRTELKRFREAPTATSDGVAVSLLANIELPEDIRTARQAGAEGVGLYRTEYLFMNRDTPPGEEDQFRDYRRQVRALKGLPLTIRTLDLGADKQVDGAGAPGPLPTNPALGLRAVRLCLSDPGLFVPQLRAILRASAFGKVRLLVPMLSNVQEMEQVLALIDKTRAALDAEGVEYGADLQVGGMIEVPAAAICADLFARRLDFLSIGTNDLIQYTMAVDRVDDSVSYLYDPLHPAVLRMIRMVLDAGEQAGIPVAMCGEMAGDTRFTRLLLGLGLREFSVHPASILEIRRIINSSRIDVLEELAARALEAGHGVEIGALLRQINDAG